MLTFGVIIFCLRNEMFIYKTHIKRVIGFYKFVIWSRATDIKKFDSIYLGVMTPISMNATVSAGPRLDIVFSYKYPEKYLNGDSSSKAGIALHDFFSKTKYDRKNYEFFSENIMTEISKLTGLPIMISEEVKEDFGVSKEE